MNDQQPRLNLQKENQQTQCLFFSPSCSHLAERISLGHVPSRWVNHFSQGIGTLIAWAWQAFGHCGKGKRRGLLQPEEERDVTANNHIRSSSSTGRMYGKFKLTSWILIRWNIIWKYLIQCLVLTRLTLKRARLVYPLMIIWRVDKKLNFDIISHL